MHAIRIDPARCKGDGLCAAVCVRKIFTAENRGVPHVNSTQDCNLCGHCVAICPHGAIEHSGLPLANFPRRPRNLGISPEQLTLLLRSRRSIREWRDRPVPREVLERLIDAGRHAPTASNAQGIEYVVVQDRKCLQELEGLVYEGLRPGFDPNSPTFIYRFWLSRIAEFEAGARNLFLGNAPAVVVLHVPAGRELGEEDSHYAAMHMILLAETLGLGSCLIGLVVIAARRNEAIKTLLQIPPDHRIGTAFTLGYPRYRYGRLVPRSPARVTWM